MGRVHRGSGQDQQNNPPHPLSVDVQLTIKTEGDSKNEGESTNPETEKNHRGEQKVLVLLRDKDRTMLWTQIALVVVGLLTIGVVYFMSSQQNVLTEKAINNAAVSDVAHENFTRTGLRAYVSLMTDSPVRIRAGHPASNTYIIANGGKTPARYVECQQNIVVLAGNPDVNWNAVYRASAIQSGKRGNDLGVGMNTTQETIGENISREDSIAIRRGQRVLWFFALARYYDVFDSVHFVWTCDLYLYNSNSWLNNPKYSGAD
jgi:hypothetical protein